MFGLKVVKAQEFSDLKRQLQQAMEIIREKDMKITSLYEKIDSLKSKDVQLLTDVAEQPLTVEKKKRVIKKKTSTPRKKVAHKTEE